MPSAIYEGGYARSYPGERTPPPAIALGGNRWGRAPDQDSGPLTRHLDDEVPAPRPHDDIRWMPALLQMRPRFRCYPGVI